MKGDNEMTLLLIVILVIGLAGIIGNQYSGLRKMDDLQRSLNDLKSKTKDHE